MSSFKGNNLLLEEHIISLKVLIPVEKGGTILHSVSVISGQWVGDKERLCSMEPRFNRKRGSTAQAFH